MSDSRVAAHTRQPKAAGDYPDLFQCLRAFSEAAAMALGIPLHPDTKPAIAVSEDVEIKIIFVKSSLYYMIII